MEVKRAMFLKCKKSVLLSESRRREPKVCGRIEGKAAWKVCWELDIKIQKKDV